MSDRSLRQFKKEQLFVSILKCCEHRKCAIDDASALTETILSKMVRSSTSSVIAANHVASLVHETLQLFDNASAVQYAALHPEYKL
jgi:transcriptional regulator NrdR family protein